MTEDRMALVELLEKAVASAPDRASTRSALAKAQLAAGDPESGLESLVAAYDLQPAAVRTGIELASIYVERRDFARAGAIAEQILSRNPEQAPGSLVLVTREGTRPLLVEVQALVDQSPLANPRRVALGLEQNRLSMLLAVMHRHGGVAMFDQDVFLNVVGGVRVTEPAADLPR